jgi:tetratricopeptide (TPR) repeat protein
MNETRDKDMPRAREFGQRQTIALAFVILLGFACVIAISRWMDEHRPPVDVRAEEERLYMTGQTVKRMSLGFNGLVADWYWMRSLQYVGRKMLNHPGQVQLDDLGPLDMRLLYPLLDTATTIDPHFIEPYQYGAVVLPAVKEEDAIKLTEKGIEKNPHAWRLYQHLGYIYWKRGDYRKASEIYGAGAKIADAPQWMKEMSARMAAEGGSHAMAREIYTRLHEESNDEEVKKLMVRRLMQVDSFEERDAIRKAMETFRQRNGRCVATWKELFADLRAARLPSGRPLTFDSMGVPLDPSDTQYLMDKNGCDVKLDLKSKVPQQ